jgi:hypothetical protein
MRFLRILPNMALRRFGWGKIALETVNIEEAFEDDVEDAAIHGIEKAWGMLINYSTSSFVTIFLFIFCLQIFLNIPSFYCIFNKSPPQSSQCHAW